MADLSHSSSGPFQPSRVATTVTQEEPLQRSLTHWSPWPLQTQVFPMTASSAQKWHRSRHSYLYLSAGIVVCFYHRHDTELFGRILHSCFFLSLYTHAILLPKYTLNLSTSFHLHSLFSRSSYCWHSRRFLISYLVYPLPLLDSNIVNGPPIHFLFVGSLEYGKPFGVHIGLPCSYTGHVTIYLPVTCEWK